MAAPIVYTLVLSFQKKKVSGLGLGKGSQSTAYCGPGKLRQRTN
jgi:multiple sugar transport system permease protein